MKHYGLLGKTLSHSFSPRLHQRLMELLRIDGEYALYERGEDDVGAFLTSLPCDGLNVTIPYKTVVLPMLDALSSEARRIGAVNTICHRKGERIGYNTDYDGIIETLRQQNIDVSGRTVVVLGNGGAAQAVFACLNDLQAAHIYAVTRRPAVSQPGGIVSFINYKELEQIKRAQLLVNCTPVGMAPHAQDCPVSQEIVARFECVFDLIYNPLETRLLTMSRKAGLNYTNGLKMLIYQAIRAQELWNEMRLSDAEKQYLLKNVTEVLSNE